MSELIQKVDKGKIIEPSSSKVESQKDKNNSLGKDAFLQLLVTQMKYQDPLNPNTDTQFVAQLATFSQLEQMQNLGQTTTNSQAFGLVGMNVTVTAKDATGNLSLKTGVVDFVTMNNGKAQLYIDGSYYNLDQLESVYDGTYVIKKGLPYIPDNVDVTFDKSKPEDISFTVDLGSGETIATDVAIVINSNVLDSKYVKLDGKKVTINKDAFSTFDNGIYKATVVFNDALYTAASGKINITVKNSTGESSGDADNNDNKEQEDEDNIVGD